MEEKPYQKKLQENEENGCRALAELVTWELKLQSFYEGRRDRCLWPLSQHIAIFPNVNLKESSTLCEC